VWGSCSPTSEIASYNDSVLSLSPIKLLIIVAVILVVLGPDKLPEVSRQIGGAWRSLKEWQAKIETEVRNAVPDLPSTGDIARAVRSPVTLLNSMADRVMTPDSPPTTPTSPEDDVGDVPASSDAASSPAPTVTSRDTSPASPVPLHAADPSLN
jgi:TatA/E family protein of Tat protein translocase